MFTKRTNISSIFKLMNNVYCSQSTVPKPLRTPKTICFPKEQMINIGKYKINYIKVGNGDHTVLCLPGALGTIWTDFQHQIEDFAQDKFTLVVWDPPGYGKSRPPDKEFPVNFFEEDAATAAEFMKALNISTYSVLGWSNGASTSFILAARNRDAVKKLVVWGAISFIMPHELGWYKQIQNIHKTWSKSRKELLTEIYGEEGLVNYWNRWQDCMERICVKNNGNICKDLLKDIQCPTFLLYGLKEPLVDKFHVSYIQSQIQNTRLRVYPNGKHNIHIRYFKDFNMRVQNFLLEP